MKNFSPFKYNLLNFRKKTKHYLLGKSIFVGHLLLISIIISLQSCATKQSKTYSKKDFLIQKYREMRMNSWHQYKQTESLKERAKSPTAKKKKKSTSISMKHLKDNPIFQQVTQIHCFKIRASESRCNAIKYLAMANCGNITKESQIKNYTKCLEKNFK